MHRSRFNITAKRFYVVIMGKPLLLKMFQVLCLIISWTPSTIITSYLAIFFGYVEGIFTSPEQDRIFEPSWELGKSKEPVSCSSPLRSGRFPYYRFFWKERVAYELLRPQSFVAK